MALTGLPFLGCLVVATGGTFLGVLGGWTRWAGTGPRPIITRWVMLCLVSVLTLLTAVVAFNDHFVFFGEWRDLVGALQARPALLPGPGPVPTTTREKEVQFGLDGAPLHNGARVYTVRGAKSGLVGMVLVRLPAGYDDRAARGARYPVVETFNGYPAGPEQWIDVMNLGFYVKGAVRAGLLAEPIIVSPLIEFPSGVDSECVDGPAQSPKVETWLTDDVPTWLAGKFRVAAARQSWATLGLSSGGWCAAMTALLHPQRYGAAIVLGGYFEPKFEAGGPALDVGSREAARYDLVGLVRRKPPPVALWLTTSREDPLSYSSSAQLLAATRGPMSVEAVVMEHAGHRFDVWEALLPKALTWLGANIPGFRPGPGQRAASTAAAAR